MINTSVLFLSERNKESNLNEITSIFQKVFKRSHMKIKRAVSKERNLKQKIKIIFYFCHLRRQFYTVNKRETNVEKSYTYFCNKAIK